MDAQIEQFRAALMESQQIDTGVHIGGSRGWSQPTTLTHSHRRSGHTRPDRIGAAEKTRTGRGRTQADCILAPERWPIRAAPPGRSRMACRSQPDPAMPGMHYL